MLKRFFLIVCGSFVGTFLALLCMIITTVLMSFVIFGSMSSSMSKKIEKNSIMYMRLEGSLDERETMNPAAFMTLMPSQEKNQSLSTLIKGLKLAKHNNDIKGLYIDCRGMAAGMSSLYELRKAIEDFKSSKKFVYAFGDAGINQGDYYLASVADSIFVNPEGMVDVHGLGSMTPYMKKLLDKVGVEMQVVRVGTFKSAVEPFMLESMSDANRLQQEHYLGSLWKVISEDIAKSRNIDITRFNALTDSLMATMDTKELKANKLIDNICYRSEMDDKLRALTKVEKDEDLKLVTANDLISSSSNLMTSGDQVAVVYATGEIDGTTGRVPGMASDGIDSEDLAATIRKLQYDDEVKALVLRVNSPGGSAFGSEVIWKAIEDFKKTGKPVAVSMSDYAASGGYYISSGSQRIFAEPLTITGSIGIFGMFPNASSLINNTLGVKIEQVTTNKNSLVGNMFTPLRDDQIAALQKMVNRGYETFTKRCADGRNMSQDSIKVIGEGRVWDAVTAKEIGLVDELGGLDDAVKWVAKQAKLKEGNYAVIDYPDAEMSFMEMFGYMYSMKQNRELRERMGMFYTYYEQLETILNRDHLLCIMEPIEIVF